jgi:hypothetical protein
MRVESGSEVLGIAAACLVRRGKMTVERMAR